nr:DsbA family protein [Iamia sp. SCSIO 61187]
MSLALIVCAAIALAAVALLGGDDGEPEKTAAGGSEQDDRLAGPTASAWPPGRRGASARRVPRLRVRGLPSGQAGGRSGPPGLRGRPGDRRALHAAARQLGQCRQSSRGRQRPGQVRGDVRPALRNSARVGRAADPRGAALLRSRRADRLDMDEFSAVYEDPATEAKVERDQADGEDLGVTGTPTFFLDGEELDLSTVEDLTAQLDEAVGR